MAYLNPVILELFGLRQRPEDEEEIDASREGERGPVSPYAGITPPVPSPVAPAPAPNPYRQVGSLPWVTEQPSTTKPDETVRREIPAPITEGPAGERTLTAPEGMATWTPEQPGQPVSALARRIGLYPGVPPGTYSSLTGTFTPRAEEDRRATLMAEAEARKETQKQNLIADILSTSRSYWGKPTVGPKGEVSGGEADRVGRVGELLTVLKEIYGTSALGGILGAGEGGGAGPGGLVPTGVTVDEKGGIKRTFGLPPSPNIGRGATSRSYEDYLREAETKGLTGAERTRYAQAQMRLDAEAMATARGVGATAPPVVAGQAVMAGARAAATRGPQLPLTPAEATQAGVPMGITRGDLAGQIPTTPKTRQSIAELDVSQNMLDHLGGLADQLITAEDAVQAAAQGVKLMTGAALRSNTAAAVFDDQRRALLGVFSRQIGAERGVLTDRDIERIDSALPRFRDTKAIKDQKLAFLRSMITTNREARTRAIDALLGGRALGGGPAVSADPLEGKTATGPGGTKIIRRNGQWVPYGK